MKIKTFMTESYSTITINGIKYSMNNDEIKLYNKIKSSENKCFKKDFDEYDNKVLCSMVTRGLLRRRCTPQKEIYFTCRGRGIEL